MRAAASFLVFCYDLELQFRKLGEYFTPGDVHGRAGHSEDLMFRPPLSCPMTVLLHCPWCAALRPTSCRAPGIRSCRLFEVFHSQTERMGLIT